MVVRGALIIAAGILCACGIFIPSLWFLSILSVVPFAYVLYRISSHNHTQAICLGLLFGISYSGTALIWAFSVLPLDWLGIESRMEGALPVAFSWLSTSIALGAAFALFAWAFVRYRSGNWTDTLLAASLWTLVQYLHMYVFAIFTIAPASLLGAHFSMTMLGYSLAWFSPLLQFASLGGIYATTFIAAGLGFLTYHVVFSETKINIRRAAILVVALVAVTTIDQGRSTSTTISQKTPTMRIALVSTNFPNGIAAGMNPGIQEGEEARRDAILNAVRTWGAAGRAIDIMVFPEVASVFAASTSPDDLRKEAFQDRPVAFVDSHYIGNTDGTRSLRMHYHVRGQQPIEYDKMFFVPQGEYTPRLALAFADYVLDPITFERIEQKRLVTRGTSTVVAMIGDTTLGGLFCSEVLSPILYRSQVGQGAEILVNASSHAFFHGSPILREHVLAIAKTRAVETGRYVAIAGNMLPAIIISDKGGVVVESDQKMVSIISRDVPRLTRSTPYVELGERVLVVPIALVLWFLSRRKARHDERVRI